MGGGELGTDPELSADETESLSIRFCGWFSWFKRTSDGESIDDGDGDGDKDWGEMSKELKLRSLIFLEEIDELFEFDVEMDGFGDEETFEKTDCDDNSEELLLIKLFVLLNFDSIEDIDDIPLEANFFKIKINPN